MPKPPASGDNLPHSVPHHPVLSRAAPDPDTRDPAQEIHCAAAPYHSRILSSDPALLGNKPLAFDSFLRSEANHFVLHMLEKSAQGSTAHNPLILHGPSGAGKTLLLRIMANAYALLPGSGPVYLLPARDFAFFLSPVYPEHYAFRHALRRCAAFCLDDVQHLQGSPEAQQELAGFLDYWQTLSVPVLISTSLSGNTPGNGQSRDTPAALLLPELFSRLCVGLSLDIAEANLDMKMRCAQALFAENGLKIQRESALILARRCAGLRQIQGAVSRIRAFHAYSGQLPDERDLDTILSSSGSLGSMTPEAVLAVVAARCGFTTRDLRGKGRRPELVQARQLAMFLCRELLGESYPALGKIFGGKDHSTVIHAVKKIQKMQIENTNMHNLVTELTQRCRYGNG